MKVFLLGKEHIFSIWKGFRFQKNDLYQLTITNNVNTLF